ncbi:MAG: D-amino acid dehydrogenase [Psychrobium sp.]
MKVVVLGSGVIGLTSAWYLAQTGCEVTVIDRQAKSGQETSFANAGQISYGYSSPWAAPGVPLKALKWMLSKHSPLVINPKFSLSQIGWMWQLLRNCSHANYQRNKGRMLALANYSQQALMDLREQLPLAYQGRQQGTLQLLRTQQQIESLAKDIALLKASGIEHQLLDAQDCLAQEPALQYSRCDIAGGLLLPQDETGDCELFCQSLTQQAKQIGIKFLFNTNVTSLETQQKRVMGVNTSQEFIAADKVVVALGSYSAQLLEPLGLSIPVYPVKGYSLTMPISDAKFAPQSTVMDETHKVALTRFDDRIRVAGTAQLCGFDLELPPKRVATLNKVVRDLFPNVGSLDNAEYWTGLRPMTPDGTPIIGATALENLYLNTGHGTLGWTLACGSAKLLAEQMTSRKSVLNPLDYQLGRY